jgi:hypothetical protein
MTEEVQPPCVKCRHAEICTASDMCHAARYFGRTGLPITPPLRYPGARTEPQKRPLGPAARPRIASCGQVFTNDGLQALAGLQRDMEES